MKNAIKPRLSGNDYIKGILSADRVVLGQAITLVESHRQEDQELTEKVLTEILPKTGNSIRIGISGVPGVGKSTFIESFGKLLTAEGKKVAVLTIDPSSKRTRGSILGDKTRMEELSKEPNAFIRPSASGKSLGGVAAKTRESLLLCEAAGYDVIIIETVGVGQSETEVRNMVDFFLLLMLPGAGDELQGIKKGIMEMADLIVINKADGDNLKKAKEAKSNYEQAIHLFEPNTSGWPTKAITCSAIEKTGLKDVWELINEYQQHTLENGYFESNRKSQSINWMNAYFQVLLQKEVAQSPALKTAKASLEKEVGEQKLTAYHGAHKMFEVFLLALKEKSK